MHGNPLSQDYCPKKPEKKEGMQPVGMVGTLMYEMLYTKLDICIIVGMVSRYQSNPTPEH